ncbi:MAG: hypothetical protein ACFB22_13215 [Rhodothalassiaceae bacterium]
MTKPRYRTAVIRTKGIHPRCNWLGKADPKGAHEDDTSCHPDYEALETEVAMACNDLSGDGYRILQTVGLKAGFGAWGVDKGLEPIQFNPGHILQRRRSLRIRLA